MSEQEECKPSSARYGRRAAGKGADSAQEELEKYWRSLHEFRQFHKGRLDSANNEDDHLYGLGEL